MNATRAVTVSSRAAAPRPRAPQPPGPPRRGQRRQSDSPLYSIGRVQTPTLAILVRRELEIRQFRPRDYWEVRGVFVPAGAPADATEKVTATWGVALPDGKAIRSRLGERALADGVVARGERAAGGPHGPVVERLRQKRVREPPPLLFDLTSLQRTANRRYGLSATATLAAAQALYERYKILTYPRTDSRHLTSDMAKELPKLFGALAALPDYAPFAAPLLETPPARSRRVFDDGKVSDHHAIVPTGKPVRLDELPRDERRIFDLVARRFLGAFHPDAEFALTDVVIRVGPPEAGPRAAAEPRRRRRGRTVGRRDARDGVAAAARSLPRARSGAARRRLAGGRAARRAAAAATRGRGDGGRRGGPTLPPLAEGQRLDGKLEVMTKQTRPPPRHTEATLLGAMESAGRDISDDELRAAMRDSGLGTPATRAATIETLIRRTFVARDGKNLVPTDMGIGLIDALPEKSLASPELTGTWEARLSRVARGEETRAAFMADISRYVSDVVTAIRGGAGVVRAPAAPRRAPRRARRGAGDSRAAARRTRARETGARQAGGRKRGTATATDAHLPALQAGHARGGKPRLGLRPLARGLRVRDLVRDRRPPHHRRRAHRPGIEGQDPQTKVALGRRRGDRRPPRPGSVRHARRRRGAPRRARRVATVATPRARRRSCAGG